MPDNEKRDRHLKAFEADLAALRPRTDRLDPGCRARLAEEAAEHEESGRLCFSITGHGEGATPGASSGAGVMLKHNLQSCANPAGHEFVCLHCGSAAPLDSRARRWAWPAALSAMTAVAAVLLVMLTTHWGPQVTKQADQHDMASPAPTVAAEPENLESAPASGYGLAVGDFSRPALTVRGEGMSYLTLRDHVLRYGVEASDLPTAAAVSGKASEGPLTQRELLKRLLGQQGLRGS